jgi:DNA-binding NarL/FixJ family response regulator
MEASATVGVVPAGLDAVVMAAVASDDALRTRLTQVTTAVGVDLRATEPDLEELLAHDGLDALTTVLISAPASQAADLVAQVRKALPRVAVLLMPAANTTPTALRRLLDCGADGIVLESQLETALAGTLAAVEGGQVVLPRAMVRKGQTPLSFREKQILALVVMGFTNAGIASKLFLAESTVKSHLSSAFTKLGVRSRHEAAALLADPHQMGLGVLTIARD